MKVLLVGTLPVQTNEISGSFTGIEIGAWDEKSLQRLASDCKAADIVVVMTGKTSHKAMNVVTKYCSRRVLCSGGVTSIKHAISKLGVQNA